LTRNVILKEFNIPVGAKLEYTPSIIDSVQEPAKVDPAVPVIGKVTEFAVQAGLVQMTVVPEGDAIW